MNFICTNCGTLNDNNIFTCENCNVKIDENKYLKLKEYASRAAHYGYTYRIEYEKQVAELGEIQTKYSLIQPNIWYEWLAMAALSGVVGTYATDLVKYVAKQIIRHFKEKIENNNLTDEEQKLVNFISNNNTLNKFTIYINNYYNGLPK